MGSKKDKFLLTLTIRIRYDDIRPHKGKEGGSKYSNTNTINIMIM